MSIDQFERQRLRSGDTSDTWEIAHATSAAGVTPLVRADLTGDYSCHMRVEGASPEIARQVMVKNVANTHFISWLSPAETLALGKGTWTVIHELRNLTLVPELVREIHGVVSIEGGLLPP